MALKVIGGGGPRTGTATLKVALETLGFGKCYHMEGIFNKPDDAKHWVDLFEKGSTDMDTLFEGYQSIVDFPGCLMYKTLLEKYPDAKVVLTLRDAEDWYESAANTVYAVTPKTFRQKFNILKKVVISSRFRKMAKVFRLVEKYLWNTHYEGQFQNREKTIQKYNDFNEEIRNFVPKGQLLEMDIKEGWGPLCAFLDVPIPDVDFPHKNKRKEFNEQIRKMMNTGGDLELK